MEKLEIMELLSEEDIMDKIHTLGKMDFPYEQDHDTYVAREGEKVDIKEDIKFFLKPLSLMVEGDFGEITYMGNMDGKIIVLKDYAFPTRPTWLEFTVEVYEHHNADTISLILYQEELSLSDIDTIMNYEFNLNNEVEASLCDLAKYKLKTMGGK